MTEELYGWGLYERLVASGVIEDSFDYLDYLRWSDEVKLDLKLEDLRRYYYSEAANPYLYEGLSSRIGGVTQDKSDHFWKVFEMEFGPREELGYDLPLQELVRRESFHKNFILCKSYQDAFETAKKMATNNERLTYLYPYFREDGLDLEHGIYVSCVVLKDGLMSSYKSQHPFQDPPFKPLITTPPAF